MPLLRMTGAFTEKIRWAVNVARIRENCMIDHFEISHLVAEVSI